MKRWLAHVLQIFMAVSLLAAPTSVVSCPVQVTAPASTCCCCCAGSCACSKDKVCASTCVTTEERAISQAASKVPGRSAVALYALIRDERFPVFETMSRTKQEAIPPPLITGSPPQAKLRIWLI